VQGDIGRHSASFSTRLGTQPVTGAVTRSALWLLACSLPVASSATALFVNVDPALWWSMPATTRRGLAADALLITIGAIVLLAPLAGVIVAAGVRVRARGAAGGRGPETAWSLTAATAMLVASSALLVIFAWGHSDAAALSLVATSHVTVFAVTLALAGFGAACGVLFRDSLDAAGCSVSVVLVAAGGLLVAGASLANAPRALVDVALTASPFVTMASAAHIDVMRMGVPYQMSPLAHVQVQYPAWYLASAWYLAIAGLCFAGVSWQARLWQLMSVRLKGRIA
jgi:hypothetical protein